MKALAVLTIGTTIHIEDAGGISRTYKIVEHLPTGLVRCRATSNNDRSLETLDERVTVICPQNNGVHLILSWIRDSCDTGADIIVDAVGKMWFVERRRYFRLRGPDIKAHYAVADKNGGLVVGMASGLVWDLSGNGMALFVESSRTIRAKTKLHLIIVLPDGTKIGITGDVIRCAHQQQKEREYLLGIHFATIDDADRERIIQYVIGEQLASMKR